MPVNISLTVGPIPVFVAGPSTGLALLENTGSVAVRIVTEAGDARHGQSIAPIATFELEPQGRFVRLACDSSTTVEGTLHTVADLRASAAAHYEVPVALLRGRTKSDIAASVSHMYGGTSA